MADNLPNRPRFALPFPAGTRVTIKTYYGHNPDDKKMDIYAEGWPHDSAVLASAPGLVHEHFEPGGLEINHGRGWFTTYMHMDQRADVGTVVERGDWIGRADTVGTGVKHLHHEQLYAGDGAMDAGTGDITYPLFVEQGPGGSPLHLDPANPAGITFTSQNGATLPPPPVEAKETDMATIFRKVDANGKPIQALRLMDTGTCILILRDGAVSGHSSQPLPVVDLGSKDYTALRTKAINK